MAHNGVRRRRRPAINPTAPEDTFAAEPDAGHRDAIVAPWVWGGEPVTADLTPTPPPSVASPRVSCGNHLNIRTAVRYNSQTTMHRILGAIEKHQLTTCASSSGAVQAPG